MTADLTGKLPAGTRRIRITTNLQIYWDSILIDRAEQGRARRTRSRADGSREISRPAGENPGFGMTPPVVLREPQLCVMLSGAVFQA